MELTPLQTVKKKYYINKFGVEAEGITWEQAFNKAAQAEANGRAAMNNDKRYNDPDFWYQNSINWLAYAELLEIEQKQTS